MADQQDIDELISQKHCETCGSALHPHVCEGLCPNCFFGSMLSPSDHEIRGTQYGDYEVEEIIASGGMGRVYRARHTTLNRTVALKLLPASPSNSAERALRFKRETEAVARLDHPNIVPIYEVGEADGDCYYSMRLIEGQAVNQRKWARKGRADFMKIAEVMAKTAEAVHFAHQHGILHRDVKPGNVLLDAADEPYLTDFGLARFLEADSEITATEAVLGTPHYMAPEQISGSPVDLTSAADIYGLGAMLYELLTGSPPFQGESTLDLLRKVGEEEPLKPSSRNGHVPIDLETIALRCLHKTPSKRYPSAHELAEDLRRYSLGEPIAARPVGSIERLLIWARRYPRTAGLVSTVTLLILALGVTGQISAQRQKVLREKAEAGEDLLRHKNYQYAIRVGQAHIDGGNQHLAPPLLWRTAPEMRGWEWGYLMAQCSIDQWSYDFGGPMAGKLECNQDGSRIFLRELDGTIVCLDAASRSVIWRRDGVGGGLLASDLTGRYLAVSRTAKNQGGDSNGSGVHGVQVLDGSTGLHIVDLGSHRNIRALWSPDGQRLYTFSTNDGRSWVTTYSSATFELLSSHEFTVDCNIALLRRSRINDEGTHLLGIGNNRKGVYAIPLDQPSEYQTFFQPQPGSRLGGISFRSLTEDAFYALSERVVRQHPNEPTSEFLYVSPKPAWWIFHLRDQPDSVIVCTPTDARIVNSTTNQVVLRFPEKIRQALLLDDQSLVTLSERGVVRRNRLTEKRFNRHHITASPGADGRGIDISDDGSLIVFQDWENRSFHIGRLNPGSKLSFKEYTFNEWGHIKSKGNTFPSLPVFRPGSRELVTRTLRGIRFHSFDSTSPSLVKNIDIGQEPYYVRFDQTGNQLVYTVENKLGLIDLKTNERRTLLPGAGEPPGTGEIPIRPRSHLQFNPTGEYVAITSDADVLVLRISDGSVLFRRTFGSRPMICLHPTKPTIAILTTDMLLPLTVYNFETSETVITMKNHQQATLWMGFSSDGRRLLVNSGGGGQVAVWDWEYDLELLRIGHQANAFDGAMTPDGRMLGSTDYNPNVHLRFALPWHYDHPSAEFQRAVADLDSRLAAYRE